MDPSISVTITGDIHIDLSDKDKLMAILDILQSIQATTAVLHDDMTALQVSAATLSTGLDAVKAEIEALQAQVAAGNTVSEADLQSVLTALGDVETAAQGVQTTLQDALGKEQSLP